MRKHDFRVAAFSTFAFAFFWLKTATAAPTARLAYGLHDGTESCATEEQLRAAVAAHMGYDPFRPFAETSISVDIRSDRKRFTAAVLLIDGKSVVRGERTLESSRCSDLTEAVALSISVALDPLSFTSQAKPELPPPEVAPEPTETAIQVPISRALPVETPTAPPPVRLHWEIGITTGTTLGQAPTISPQIAAFVGLRWRFYSLFLSGDVAPGFSKALDHGPGTIRVTTASASAGGCSHAGFFFACATLSAGAAIATSTGFFDAHSETFPRVLIGPRAGLSFPFGSRFEFRVLGDASFLLTPFQLDVANTRVFKANELSFSLGLGATLKFP